MWLGIAGFPLVVAFAWAYELTPEGFRRESELPATPGQPNDSARRRDYITIGMAVVALGLLLATRVLVPGRNSAVDTAAAQVRSIAVLPFDNFR